MKSSGKPVCTLRDLLHECELLSGEKALKTTDLEMVGLLLLHIRGLEGRLERAKEVFREQAAQIEKLSQKELWTFHKFNEAPADYKREYMERLNSGKSAPRTRVRAVKKTA